MPYNSKAFGIVIGRLRTEKGLTQERMSGLAGIVRSHLAALENGEKTAKLNTLWNIAYRYRLLFQNPQDKKGRFGNRRQNKMLQISMPVLVS